MNHFAVVIHDVHPGEGRVIDAIVDMLEPRVGKTLTLAIVPRWHGQRETAASGRDWNRWTARAEDLVLHGFTHRTTRAGLVAYLTRSANEFAHTTLRDTKNRLEQAQQFCERTFGRPLSGLVPPAWILPHSLPSLEGLGLDYIARFTRLETHDGDRAVRTYSWDWGVVPGIARVGALLGSRLTRGDVHVLAIHPEDVRRGLLPVIAAQVDALKAQGHVAATLSQAARSAC